MAVLRARHFQVFDVAPGTLLMVELSLAELPN
jgi:hypothetical protein